MVKFDENLYKSQRINKFLKNNLVKNTVFLVSRTAGRWFLVFQKIQVFLMNCLLENADKPLFSMREKKPDLPGSMSWYVSIIWCYGIYRPNFWIWTLTVPYYKIWSTWSHKVLWRPIFINATGYWNTFGISLIIRTGFENIRSNC